MLEEQCWKRGANNEDARIIRRFRTMLRVIQPASQKAKKYASINIMHFWVIDSRRCATAWLNGIWNRRPFTRFRGTVRARKDVDSNELEPPTFIIRSVRLHRNPFDLESNDGAHASSFSFGLIKLVDQDRLCFFHRSTDATRQECYRLAVIFCFVLRMWKN